MKLQNNYYSSIDQMKGQYLNTQKNTSSTDIKLQGMSFEDVLKQKSVSNLSSESNLKFSKHASNRLNERQIELSETQMNRLEEGAQKASEKGIQDSLVIVDGLSFIVNIPNNTVVTAMSQGESNDNIYTNIDGAVII